VIGVLTAETITTSSAELINNLALPKDGRAEVIFWIVEDMVLVDRTSDSVMVIGSNKDKEKEEIDKKVQGEVR
jgi:hypothetical protein